MTAPAGAGQPCVGRGVALCPQRLGLGLRTAQKPDPLPRDVPRRAPGWRAAPGGSGRRGQEEQAAVRVGAVAGPLDPWKIADTPVRVN